MSILEVEDVTDEIRRLRLDRPGSLDALSRALLSRIAEAVRAAADRGTASPRAGPAGHRG